MWTKRGRSLLGLSLILFMVMSYGALSKAEDPDKGVYTVRKGDTLWHISGSYLNNPRLWPKIWHNNRYIQNPNLIYPGDPIVIPGWGPLDQGARAPGGPTQKGEFAVSPEVMEEGQKAVSAGLAGEEGEKAETSMETAVGSKFEIQPYQPAPLVTLQLVADSGFIGSEGILREPRKIAQRLGKIEELSARDWVIVNFGSKGEVKVGDRFSILRPTRKIEHPVKRGRLGILVLSVGWLEIREVMEDYSKAEIGYSYIPVNVGDRLVPYQVPDFPVGLQAQPSNAEMKGWIAASREERVLGDRDIVYIDLGEKQGVKPGDVFSILRPDMVMKRLNPQRTQSSFTPMGELVVLRPGDETSSALISECHGEIERGDQVVLGKRIP